MKSVKKEIIELLDLLDESDSTFLHHIKCVLNGYIKGKFGRFKFRKR